MSSNAPPPPGPPPPATPPPQGWQAPPGQAPPQQWEGQQPGWGGPPPTKAPDQRPWFKKKRFIIPIVLVVLMIVGAALSGGGSDDDESSASSDRPAARDDQGDASTAAAETLFPGRPDAQEEDQERNIGESVEFSGYTTTVNSAGFAPQVSEFETDGYVKVNVTVFNRDDAAQPYNVFDWRLQTPGGQVIDPWITSAPTLGSGDLVAEGEVTGDVYFNVGAQKGDFYIVYKPDPFDAARGIWKVTV